MFADLETRVPDESLLVERLSEEHANVRVLDGGRALKTGDLVRVAAEPLVRRLEPRRRVWLVDGDGGDARVEKMDVAARGRIA